MNTGFNLRSRAARLRCCDPRASVSTGVACGDYSRRLSARALFVLLNTPKGDNRDAAGRRSTGPSHGISTFSGGGVGKAFLAAGASPKRRLPSKTAALGGRCGEPAADRGGLMNTAAGGVVGAELTGCGSASLNGWPGNQGTARPQQCREKCRCNSWAADSRERPAPIKPSGGEG